MLSDELTSFVGSFLGRIQIDRGPQCRTTESRWAYVMFICRLNELLAGVILLAASFPFVVANAKKNFDNSLNDYFNNALILFSHKTAPSQFLIYYSFILICVAIQSPPPLILKGH